jgi:xanthine dehydrogenase FAD-binding subunit
MVNDGGIDAFYPESVKEALEQLQPQTALIAGATQFMLQYTPYKKELPFRHLMFLENIAELKNITRKDDAIRVGALCTAAQLSSAENLPRLLREAAAGLGSPALRRRATAGGNILTASPAGDILTALYALDAGVRLQSVRGTRVLKLDQLISGPGKTVILEDELLTGIEFSGENAAEQSRYLKVADRSTNGISKVSLAAILPDRKNRGANGRVRLAYGAVGATVLRARALEQVLENRLRDDSPAVSGEEIRRLLQKEIFPIDDFRSTALYRRQTAVNLTLYALEQCCCLPG